MKPTPLSYVACCPTCKAVIMAASGDPTYKREAATEVGKAIRDGYELSRRPVEEVRAMKWGHDAACTRKPKARVEKA